MAFLIAAVVLVGALCVLNLVLVLGVVARLREHTEQLAGLSGFGGPLGIAVGEEVGPFSAPTVGGRRVVTRDALGERSGETLVGFFSPECEPCVEELPHFVEHATGTGAAGRRALAVVVGVPDEKAGPMVTALSPAADVVVEPEPDGPLSTAFKVEGLPAVVRVAPDGLGRLVVTGVGIEPGAPATTTA